MRDAFYCRFYVCVLIYPLNSPKKKEQRFNEIRLNFYNISGNIKKARSEPFFLVFHGDTMIQCKDCELFELDPNGRRIFHCDPFVNIKEPECLVKWQLLRLDMLVSMYRGMSAWQEKMGPIQDKIFKYVKRELEDLDESDRWKVDPEDPDEPLY